MRVEVKSTLNHDIETIAGKFDIADCLAREIVYMNDEYWKPETSEERWQRMRKWVEAQLTALD